VFNIEMNRIKQFLTDRLEEQIRLEEEEEAEAMLRAASANVMVSPTITFQPGSSAGRESPSVLNSVRENPLRVDSVASDLNKQRSGNTNSGPHGSSGAFSPKKPKVDFTFTTIGGKKVDLNRVSSTFRAGNASSPMSFRAGTVRKQRRTGGGGGGADIPTPSFTPAAESISSDHDRYAAIASDLVFGRLEEADNSNDEVDELDVASTHSVADDALIEECEGEMAVIEALINRLSHQGSASSMTVTSPNTPFAQQGIHAGSLQPAELGLPTVDHGTRMHPAREEGESSGAP
jgi:hypothetical protein